MDFIEEWFGISPDGGDGSLEYLIVFVVILVIIAIAVAVRRNIFTLLLRNIKQLGKRKDRDESDS